MDHIIEALHFFIKQSVQTQGSILSWIKRVFWWDPKTVDESNMPAIIVRPRTSNYNSQNTKLDRKVYTVEVILIYNMKQYFNMWQWDAIEIDSITQSWSTATITVDTPHGLNNKDEIQISNVDEKYDWPYKVTVIDSTSFTIENSNSITYTWDGIVRAYNVSKVFTVADAIKKMEWVGTNTNATESQSIVGIIQSNQTLAHWWVPRASFSRVVSVVYQETNNRGFPAYEVIGTVDITVLADRTT